MRWAFDVLGIIMGAASIIAITQRYLEVGLAPIAADALEYYNFFADALSRTLFDWWTIRIFDMKVPDFYIHIALIWFSAAAANLRGERAAEKYLRTHSREIEAAIEIHDEVSGASVEHIIKRNRKGPISLLFFDIVIAPIYLIHRIFSLLGAPARYAIFSIKIFYKRFRLRNASGRNVNYRSQRLRMRGIISRSLIRADIMSLLVTSATLLGVLLFFAWNSFAL